MSRGAGAGREHSQTQRAKLAGGNIPYCGHHAQFINGGWLEKGGRNLLFFREFSLFPEFGKFCIICEFGEICELQETHRFHNRCSGTGCESVVGQ